MSKDYFDDDMEKLAHEKLLELEITGQCDNDLIEIAYNLYDRLLNKKTYCAYDNETKQDMKSMAIQWLLIYGRNYNPIKSNSKHPAYTFITSSAESAFKRVLTIHYKNINMDKWLKTAIIDYYNYNLNIDEEISDSESDSTTQE